MVQDTNTDTVTNYTYFFPVSINDWNEQCRFLCRLCSTNTDTVTEYIHFSLPSLLNDWNRTMQLSLQTMLLNTNTDTVTIHVSPQSPKRLKRTMQRPLQTMFQTTNTDTVTANTRFFPVSTATETNNAASPAAYAPKHKHWHSHCLCTILSSQSPIRPKQTLAMQLPQTYVPKYKR